MGKGAVLWVVGFIILRGWWKGTDVYAAMLHGGKQGMQTAIGLFPALCAMSMLLTLMEASGLSALLASVLSPLMQLMNLPAETATLLVLRPLSGSGSMTALERIFAQYGVDSRTGKVASVLMGSSETIFYTMTVYLGATDIRKLPWVVPISLLSYLAAACLCGILM